MKLFHKLNGKWSEVTSSNEGSSSDINLPEGGSDGYLLSKLGDNLNWTNPKDVGTKLPEDGLSGQVLSLDSNKNLKMFLYSNVPIFKGETYQLLKQNSSVTPLTAKSRELRMYYKHTVSRPKFLTK